MRETGAKLNPRKVALDVLEKTRTGIHVQAALATSLNTVKLSPQDRQLCTDLVYGTLREQIRIQFITGKFLPKPEKLPPQFLSMLAPGIYGLVSQENIPAYATINESVKLIKRRFGQKLAGVANGLLRAIEREKPVLQKPDWYIAGSTQADQWLGLCTFYGMPVKIGNLWKIAWGKEIAELLLRRSASRPWSGLRINIRHPLGETALAELQNLPDTQTCGSSGIAIPPGKVPEKVLNKDIAHWRDNGLLAWQAPGSMLVMESLGLGSWNKPVWDCCAGNGGKSAWLIEQGVAVALASDTSFSRLGSTASQYHRPYCNSPAMVTADALNPPVSEWNGHILADVPCSGLGVLARRPDIRHKCKPDFEEYTNKQRAILESAEKLLKPGNELAYITCTLNPAENENMIETFLAAHPGMEPVRQWHTPHDHPWLEGMYGVLLRKN